MRYKDIGSSGLSASVAGLGTWGISGWQWGGTEVEKSIRAIHAAIDTGVNLIDCAPIYGFGLAEEIVGKAIVKKRHGLVLATKCGLVWTEDKETGKKKISLTQKPDSIGKELENSLKRLRTDYIDLYQTHWQDNTVPISETMGALLDLQKQGKIRMIGVSNINIDQLLEYFKYGAVASVQERYSMIDREMENGLLQWCDDRNVGVLAYSPLSQGLLTGKVSAERVFPDDDQRSKDPRFERDNRIKVNAMLEELKPYAEKYRVGIVPFVIAWTACVKGITHVLCGARTVEEAVENSLGGTFEICDSDIDEVSCIIKKYGRLNGEKS